MRSISEFAGTLRSLAHCLESIKTGLLTRRAVGRAGHLGERPSATAGIKAGALDVDDPRMTGRLTDDAALSVDDVASIARRERQEVLMAISNRALAARQERGEWVITARDMRRWLARR
jgi:hypothetical protein